MVYLSVCLFAFVLFTGHWKADVEGTPVQKVSEAKEGKVLIDNDGLIANNSIQKELRLEDDIAHKISFVLMPVPQIISRNGTDPDQDNSGNNGDDQSGINNVQEDVQPNNSTINDAGLDTSNETDSNDQSTTELSLLDTEDMDEVYPQKVDLQNEEKSVDQSEIQRLHINNDSNSEAHDSVISDDDYDKYNWKKDNDESVDISENEKIDEITSLEDSKQVSDDDDDMNFEKPTQANEYNENSDFVDRNFGSKQTSNEKSIEPASTDADISDEDYKDDGDTDIDNAIELSKHTDYSTMDEVTLNRSVYAVTMFLSVCLIAMGLFLFWNRHRVGEYIMQFKGERPYAVASARRGEEEKNLLANEFA